MFVFIMWLKSQMCSQCFYFQTIIVNIFWILWSRKHFSGWASRCFGLKRSSVCSMEKLFDFMIMGVKMQLLVSSTAEAILEVTRLHIRLVQSLLDGLPCELIPNDIYQMKVSQKCLILLCERNHRCPASASIFKLILYLFLYTLIQKI